MNRTKIVAALALASSLSLLAPRSSLSTAPPCCCLAFESKHPRRRAGGDDQSGLHRADHNQLLTRGAS